MPKNINIYNFLGISRETIEDLMKFKRILIENNKNLNLISENDEKIVEWRHIIDSAQIIDLIDKKCKKYVDLGSGAGFPGIVMAIIMKHKKINSEIHMYEKSSKKSDFLSETSKKLNLNTKVITKNVFDEIDIEANTITARAFKPIDKIFQIMVNNFKKYENLILFLGKNAKLNFLETSKDWDFEYKDRISMTSNDSKIVNIKNIKKKIE